MSREAYSYSLEAPVDEPPEQVISLVPALTESLFDLNLGQRLIGRTVECIRPEDKIRFIPALGTPRQPDLHRIIEMRPGLVLAGLEQNRQADVAMLRQSGIPVWVTHPGTVQGVFDLLWNIMNLFEETAMVARVQLMEQIYDRLVNLVESREAEAAGLPSVIVPLSREPLRVAGQVPYLNNVLYVCGAANAFADWPRAASDVVESSLVADQQRTGHNLYDVPVSLDEIEAAQPDVILLPEVPFRADEEGLAIFQKLDVPAARHQRIHVIDGALLTWSGTRVAYAMDQLPALFRW